MHNIAKNKIVNMGGLFNYINCDCIGSMKKNKNLIDVPSTFTLVGVRSNAKIDEMLAGTYTISVQDVVTDGSVNKFLFYFTLEDNTTISAYLETNNKATTIDITSPVKRLGVYAQDGYNSSQGVTTTFTNLMIEKGSEATEYEPHYGW